MLGLQGILSWETIRMKPASSQSSFNKTRGGRFLSEVSNKLFQDVKGDKTHLNLGDRFFK